MRIEFSKQQQLSTNQPNFEGYYRSELGRSVDEFLKQKEPSMAIREGLLNGINKFLEDNISKKIVGKGCHGIVYRIDDKYVLKMDIMGKYHQLNSPKKPALKGLEKLKTYYGETLVYFNRYCRILKNVSSANKSVEAGLPSKYNKLVYSLKQYDYWDNEYLPLFANLPQKSFDALAKDFATLNKLGNKRKAYAFDTVNPNNIILVGKNSLRLVDSINLSAPNSNSIAGLLNLLVNKMNTLDKAPRSLDTIELRCELIKKIFMAGEKHNLPLIGSASDKPVMYHVCKEFGDDREILRGLRNIRISTPSKNERMQKVRQFLDETFNRDNAERYY